MEPAEPEHFYKYRSLSGDAFEYTLDMVLNSRVWFSTPRLLNDPFDCVPVIKYIASKEQTRDFWKAFISRKYSHINRAQRSQQLSKIMRDYSPHKSPKLLTEITARSTERLLDEISVFSLSTKPDNELMWSHYADSHRGICYRFDASSPIFQGAQPVTYNLNRPILNPIVQSAETMAEGAFLTKSDVWSYEREWRVLRHPPKRPGLVKFPIDALTGIILGARCSNDDRDRICKTIEKQHKHIEIFEAIFDMERYRINITLK